MKKTIVNSLNEWDPLKHVIVGRADNCCIPAPEPAVDVKIPPDSVMKGKHGRRTQDSSTSALAIVLAGLLPVIYLSQTISKTRLK